MRYRIPSLQLLVVLVGRRMLWLVYPTTRRFTRLNTRFTRISGQPSVPCQYIIRVPTQKIHHSTHTRFTFPDSRLFLQQVYYFVLLHASTHTNTRTHTTRRPCSSVLSSVVPLAASCGPFVSRSQPLSPVAHVSSTPSPENLPTTLRVPPPTVCSEFRRTPSSLIYS